MIQLRTPNPQDLERLYLWENDPAVQVFSSTKGNYTKDEILDFIARSTAENLVSCGQQRFMIDADHQTVGCVDLYEFDPDSRCAGVGILVYQADDRQKGYALEALHALARYALGVYHLHSLWAEVPLCNSGACRLFDKAGYQHNPNDKPEIARLAL